MTDSLLAQRPAGEHTRAEVPVQRGLPLEGSAEPGTRWFAAAGGLTVLGSGLWLVGVLAVPYPSPGRGYVGHDRDFVTVAHGSTFVLLVAMAVVVAVGSSRWRPACAAVLVGASPWLVHRLAMLAVGLAQPEPPVDRGWLADVGGVGLILVGSACALVGLASRWSRTSYGGAGLGVFAALAGGGVMVFVSLMPYVEPWRPVELIAIALGATVTSAASRERPGRLGAAALLGFCAVGELQIAAIVLQDFQGVGRDYLSWTYPMVASWLAIVGILTIAVIAWHVSGREPTGRRRMPSDGRVDQGGASRMARIDLSLLLLGAGLAAMGGCLTTFSSDSSELFGFAWKLYLVKDATLHPRIDWWIACGYLALVVALAFGAVAWRGIVSAGALLGALVWTVADLVTFIGLIPWRMRPAELVDLLMLLAAAVCVTVVLARHARRREPRPYGLGLAIVTALFMATAGVLLGTSELVERRSVTTLGLLAVCFAVVPLLTVWTRPSRLGAAGLAAWVVAGIPAAVTLLTVRHATGRGEQVYAFVAILGVVLAIAAWLVWLVLTNADAHKRR